MTQNQNVSSYLVPLIQNKSVQNISLKMSSIYMKMNLWREYTFIWMVSHKDLIWHRGKRQLENENGLLFVNCNPYLLSGGSRHCKWKFLGQLSHLAILPVAPPHIQQLSPPAAWNDTKQTQCDHQDKIQLVNTRNYVEEINDAGNCLHVCPRLTKI